MGELFKFLLALAMLPFIMGFWVLWSIWSVIVTIAAMIGVPLLFLVANSKSVEDYQARRDSERKTQGETQEELDRLERVRVDRLARQARIAKREEDTIERQKNRCINEHTTGYV